MHITCFVLFDLSQFLSQKHGHNIAMSFGMLLKVLIITADLVLATLDINDLTDRCEARVKLLLKIAMDFLWDHLPSRFLTLAESWVSTQPTCMVVNE